MRICLINPSYLLDPSEDNEQSINGYTVPHLGLGYITSFLQNKGYSVDLFECMGEHISNQDLYRIIEGRSYSVFGISVYDDNRMNAMRIVQKIRKIKPDVFIFLGGYTPALSYESVLKSFNIDCCIIGEGEITIFELIQAIDNNIDFHNVPGIAYLSEKNVVLTKPRSLINDLDILSFPVRTFYKNQMLTMVSSRGCLCNCIYCSITSFYRKGSGSNYRCRSAENVVAEIKVLLKEYPDCKLIWYFDDNFLESTKNNRERLFEFCRLLQINNIYIPFNITVCSKDVISSEDLLIKLKDVGLNQVFVGIESLCQRQLDFYKKNITVQDNIMALDILRKLNIKINMGFIPMDPFVTITEIKTNFEMLRDHEILNDAYNIFSIHMHLVSIQGTPLKTLLDDAGISENNEKGYRFVQENVNRFYNLLVKWHKIILPMVSKSDLITANQKNNKIQFEKLDKLFRDLISLDIDYVISLCDEIEKETSDNCIIMDHMEIWEEKYYDLYRVFNRNI